MLVLLLPTAHRDTLKAVLDLCAKVVAHERENKMGLYNVAMIMAPNIFLPSLQPKPSKLHLRPDDKDHQLHSEVSGVSYRVEKQATLFFSFFRHQWPSW